MKRQRRDPCVGDTIEVLWAAEKKWFAGRVAGVDASDDTHEVRYDDGDVMWHDLKDFTWRLLASDGSNAAKRHAAEAVAAVVSTTRTPSAATKGSDLSVQTEARPEVPALPSTAVHASRSPIRYTARRVTCSPGGTKCVRFVEAAVPIEAVASVDGTLLPHAAAQQRVAPTAVDRARSPSPSLLLGAAAPPPAASGSGSTEPAERFGTIAREAAELLGNGATERTLVADYDRAEKAHAKCRAKLWLALLKRHQEFMASASAEGGEVAGGGGGQRSPYTQAPAPPAQHRLQQRARPLALSGGSEGGGAGSAASSDGGRKVESESFASIGTRASDATSAEGSGSSGSSGSDAGGALCTSTTGATGGGANDFGALEPAVAAKRTLQLAARVNPACSNTDSNRGNRGKPRGRDNTTPPRIVRPRFDGERMVSSRSARGRSPLGKRPPGNRYF